MKPQISKSKLLEKTLVKYLSGTIDSTFLCINISAVHHGLCGTYNMGGTDTDLRKWISVLLTEKGRSFGSYDNWMAFKHPKRFYKMTEKDFIDARVQWLTWMIDYWKEQESKP